MTTALLDNIKAQFTPKMMQRISVLFDETPTSTQQAIDGVLPTLLAGVTHFSASGSGASQLVDMITHGDYSTVLNNISGLLDGGNTAERMMNSGRNILNMVFTDKLPAVSELISKSSGLKSASVASLLSLAAPVVMGVIARTRADQSLNAVGLSTLLQSQWQSIERLVPIGLGSILELHSREKVSTERANTTPASVTNDMSLMVSERQHVGDSRPPWGWLGVGIVALSVVYWLWGRGSVTP